MSNSAKSNSQRLLRLGSALLLSSFFSLSWSCAPQGGTPTATSSGVIVPKSQAQPHGQLQILPGVKPAIRFAISYPNQASGFRTQAINCASFSRFQVSVSGVGMPSTLYPAAAVAAQNNTIPATGCTLNTTVPNVPSGEARVARIVPYDAAGNQIPGLTLGATFDVTANPTTVELSYLSTPAGQIVYDILNVLHDPVLATTIDRAALQTLINTITQAGGTFPNYTYGVNPFLVDQADILQALITANGNVGQLSPTNPAFILSAGSVTGTIAGLVSSDKVTVRVMDPISGALVNQANGNFNIANVPPGTWKLEIVAPPGYTHNAPATITVSEGGSAALGTITFTPAQPAIASLGASSGAPGSTLIINGSNFNANADGNTVIIGGVTVPASDITVISSTQLEVKVPSTAPLGNTTVSVAVGGQTAASTPAFEVTPPIPGSVTASNQNTTSFDLNWGSVPGATQYNVYKDGVLYGTYPSSQTSAPITGLTAATSYQMQVSAVVSGVESNKSPALNVSTISNWTGFGSVGLSTESILALAAPASNDNVVWAGSLRNGGTTGGVWKCVNNGVGDTCTNMLPGATSNSIQALAINPQNADIVVAGSVANGIYRTTDGGSNWTQIGSAAGLTALNVRALAFDPLNPNTIYAGTAGGGVFRSTDSGASWATVNLGLPSANVGALSLYIPASGPTVIYAGTNGSGVARATTTTLTTTGWATINNGLDFSSSIFLGSVDVRALVAHPTNAAQLYGAGTGGCTFVCQLAFGKTYLVGIWQRTDPGDWVEIGGNGTNSYPDGTPSTGLTNMNVMALAIDPLLTNNIYAATQGGLFRSTNGGTSWNPMSSGLPSPTITVNTIAINTQRLYLGTTSGVFRAN